MIFDQQQRDIQELKHAISSTKAGMQFIQMKFHEEFNSLGMHIHGLAHAASGYHRVLEENRKLYNQVQDLKGSIRVYCRSLGSLQLKPKFFSDMQPLIRSVLDGYNVCIFAYGQTGSGKTYTMSGPKDLTEKNQGVNYRALGDLFLLAEQRRDTFRYDVAVQMMEIYNEQVRDLLVTDGNANLISVSSTSDVIDLMNLGQRNRAVGVTALKMIVAAVLIGRDLTSGAILAGCMHLVDLAGSERVDKSEVTGDRLKEAQHINKSLSALGDVIASLAQKNHMFLIETANSLNFFKIHLEGQAKTLMFVHISPEPDAIGETISTLKFAERVATVELGAARVNKDTQMLKNSKKQIASLKAALAREEGEMDQSQHSVSGSSEKYRAKASDLSPFNPNQRVGDVLVAREPMGIVGNIEVCTNSTLREKRQSFDLG
ncbi:hypothetical protein V6N12_011552 [Hibiscus sabdariffa]|uniref:Kinesin motor domain-containing protein n=1 Tax=Hibiscus sabdariffa TaxID=183260 RepID=A0ABR2AYU9_9ROSI